MALSLAVTLDETRLAARLEVTDIPAGTDTLTITRTAPSGDSAGVRGATGADVEGMTSAIVRDYELPFNVDIVYVATAVDLDGPTVSSSGPVTFRIDWPGCDVWLCDLARPTNSLVVEIESMRELAYETAVGVHRVLDRRAPVLTALPAWTPSTELIVLTETLNERDQVRVLLGSGYPFLLRAGDDLGIGNIYLGVANEFVEERILTLGRMPQRRFRVACVQVERPDPAIYVPAPPNTWDNVEATYATWDDLTATGLTWDQLAYTYPEGAGVSPVTPWLPDDV